MIPMMPMSPSVDPMQGNQQGSNVLSGLIGLPEKMIKKVMTTVSGNMADTLSQHANDAVSQGVPWGHIIDELLKASPVAGAAMFGGGSPPPGGGQPGGNGGPGGGGPPPQGPGPLPPRQDAHQFPQGDTAQPSNEINAALTGQPTTQSTGQQFNMPSFLGIKPSAQNQLTLTQAALGQQEFAGQKPMQIGEVQRAEQVPPTQYEKGQQQAAAYMAQVDNAQKQVQALNDEEARATANFTAMVNSRGMVSKAFTPKVEIAKLKANLDDIATRRDQANQKLIDLYGQHPNLKTPGTINSKQLIGQTIGKYKVVGVK